MEKIIKKDFKEQHIFFVNEKDSPHLIEKLINKLKVFIEKNKSLLPDLVKIDKINVLMIYIDRKSSKTNVKKT